MNEIVGSTYLKQMKDESENLFFFVAGLCPTSTLLILLIAYVNLLFCSCEATLELAMLVSPSVCNANSKHQNQASQSSIKIKYQN